MPKAEVRLGRDLSPTMQGNGSKELQIDIESTNSSSTENSSIFSENEQLIKDASSRHTEEVVRELSVDPNYGLSSLDVSQRQRVHGFNELSSEEEVGIFYFLVV
jgi:magnesium-transporting ATPase (P-type)